MSAPACNVNFSISPHSFLFVFFIWLHFEFGFTVTCSNSQLESLVCRRQPTTMHRFEFELTRWKSLNKTNKRAHYFEWLLTISTTFHIFPLSFLLSPFSSSSSSSSFRLPSSFFFCIVCWPNCGHALMNQPWFVRPDLMQIELQAKWWNSVRLHLRHRNRTLTDSHLFHCRFTRSPSVGRLSGHSDYIEKCPNK